MRLPIGLYALAYMPVCMHMHAHRRPTIAPCQNAKVVKLGGLRSKLDQRDEHRELPRFTESPVSLRQS